MTGASSGIGAALSRALRAKGYHVVGLSRRPAEEVDESVACDVSDREAVEAAAAEVLARHPELALLVNNAGIASRGTFLEAEPEQIRAPIETNYLGSVWCVRAFLPGLVPGSCVVHVVSVAGLVAVGPYSASKHAQLALSRSLAAELGPRRVRVLTVNPGFVETPGFPQGGRFSFPVSLLVARPELVARRTMAALDRGRREIVVPRWYRPAGWAQALAPGLLARLRERVPVTDV